MLAQGAAIPTATAALLRPKSRIRHRLTVRCQADTPPSAARPAGLVQKLTVSDPELVSRGFAVHRSPAGLDLDELNSVFARVGFPRRRPDKIAKALEHTPTVLWIEDTRSGKPVAFARATGDGVFNAIIWDVVVDPSFQGLGLGKAIMERVVGDLLEMGIVNIALYAEPQVLGFYRPLGFCADPDGIRGMVYLTKNKKNQ
ncbi:unnamed protein product [Victoria cruziana]